MDVLGGTTRRLQIKSVHYHGGVRCGLAIQASNNKQHEQVSREGKGGELRRLNILSTDSNLDSNTLKPTKFGLPNPCWCCSGAFFLLKMAKNCSTLLNAVPTPFQTEPAVGPSTSHDKLCAIGLSHLNPKP